MPDDDRSDDAPLQTPERVEDEEHRKKVQGDGGSSDDDRQPDDTGADGTWGDRQQ